MCSTQTRRRRGKTGRLSRRLLPLACTALMLWQPGVATAGIGDWWDIFSGASQREIERLDKRADVTLAWHHSKRLHEIKRALETAILHKLDPWEIKALRENLDDPRLTLDDLRLPTNKRGMPKLSFHQSRERLGLPAAGLDREGIAVRRHKDRMIIYHDTARRGLLRFSQAGRNAQTLLATLHRDIRLNPPGGKGHRPIGEQLDEHMPLLIRDGNIFHHDGTEATACQAPDGLPAMTIGLCSGIKLPDPLRLRVTFRRCVDNEAGDGSMTFYRVIEGKEPDCVPKPPPDKPGWTTWTTNVTETGTYRVGGCTQRRQRPVTLYWRQSARPGSAKQLLRKWPGQWRDVGRLDCPYNNFTTTETETGTYSVNNCTQRRQRPVTLYWRRSTRPGSTKQLRYKTHGPWRDVGKPYGCPQSVGSRKDTTEWRTIDVRSCKQRQKRQVIRFFLTRADGTQEAGFPYSIFGRWTNEGGLFDCPKPVASTTVSYQTRRSCHQTVQESRSTSAEYRLFVYKRQVTHNWLTYRDGRREAATPPVRYGPWVPERQTYSCRPGGGDGGAFNSGENPGTTYDTDGDGRTDSTQPGPAGHFGSSTSGLGSATGWTDTSAGAGRGGRGSGFGYSGYNGSGGSGSSGGGVSGGVASGDSFDDGGGYSGGSGGGVSGGGTGLY